MTRILFLTVHKAASTFFGSRVLPRLARQTGAERVDPFKAAWRDGAPDCEIVLDAHAARRDCVLGPVRTPSSIRDAAAFDGWKKILLLRDPRDVVTSFWFSQAHSHVLPPDPAMAARALRNRQAALERGIDEHVLALAAPIAARFLDYRDRFAGRPQLGLFRYEQMVTDRDGFSAGLRDFLDLDVRPALWRRLLGEEGEFTVEEDPEAHKRQVLPGDHRRKLRPETIARLDAEFAPVLDWLGYPRG
jgi:hypothetical protein